MSRNGNVAQAKTSSGAARSIWVRFLDLREPGTRGFSPKRRRGRRGLPLPRTEAAEKQGRPGHAAARASCRRPPPALRGTEQLLERIGGGPWSRCGEGGGDALRAGPALDCLPDGRP